MGEINIVDKVFLDTNALINYVDRLDELDKIYISSVSLGELEEIKTSGKKDEATKFLARKATRYLSENQDKLEVIPLKDIHYDLVKYHNLQPTNDNLIIVSALKEDTYHEVVFVTDDLLCEIFARDLFGLRVEKVFGEKDQDEYKGYREVLVDMNSEDENKWLAGLYSTPEDNPCELLINEYLIVRDSLNDEVIDKFRWNGKNLEVIKYKAITNKFMGKIKPRNIHQELLFNMLQNEDIKVHLVAGKFGTGKDYTMLAHALNLVEKGKYEKLVYVRNNIEVANSNPIGHLPGTANEKLLPYVMNIADHVGGQFGLEMMMKEGSIEVQHLGFIRGRDIKNSIVYCSEVENMTKEHMQLILGRIGEDSILYLNGDLKQVDKNIFKVNNGMKTVVDRLKGNSDFGYIELERSERSEVARMADLLD